MEGSTTLVAAFLGLLEGLTEFIPVSSTGHLLLAGHFLGFESAGKTFEVVIQLGAVLAILTIYAQRLIAVAAAAPNDAQARRFIWSVLIAFLPAVVIGVLAHDFIKTILFETPILIAAMLILAGMILPQVSAAIDDARESAMLNDLHKLTSAIERFKADHDGAAPVLQGNNLPQLFAYTDYEGNIGSGPGYPIEPYLRQQIPANPLNGDRRVHEVTALPVTQLETKTGWYYYPTTGKIWAGQKRLQH